MDHTDVRFFDPAILSSGKSKACATCSTDNFLRRSGACAHIRFCRYRSDQIILHLYFTKPLRNTIVRDRIDSVRMQCTRSIWKRDAWLKWRRIGRISNPVVRCCALSGFSSEVSALWEIRSCNRLPLTVCVTQSTGRLLVNRRIFSNQIVATLEVYIKYSRMTPPIWSNSNNLFHLFWFFPTIPGFQHDTKYRIRKSRCENIIAMDTNAMLLTISSL